MAPTRPGGNRYRPAARDGRLRPARGKRNLLPLELTWLALAIPPSGEVIEQIADGLRRAEPLAQHLRDLAQRSDVVTVPIS